MTPDAPPSKATPPRRLTLSCRTVATGGSKQVNLIRALPPLVVEERFGPPGDAPAATPSETLLAALGSCLSAHIHANASSGSILVQSLELVVEADLAPNPMWLTGRAPGPVGFESIRVAVHMQADASPEALRALVAHALMWSPVANTLHDPVHLDVTLAEPVPASA